MRTWKVIGPMNQHKIYRMPFTKIYQNYVNKAQRKNRTKAEVDEVIGWLTGYSQEALDNLTSDIDLETFFAKAPGLNPLRAKIKGVVCGIRVEDIDEELMREIRYLDKLIDELARGKALVKILRE